MDESNHSVEPREQFDSNYQRYRRQVYYCTLRSVRNKAEAEEITDETITLYFSFMERRGWPEIKSPMAYMIRIAGRLIYKRGKRMKEESLDDHEGENSERLRKQLDEKAMQENDPTSGYENAIYYKNLFERLRRTILSDLSEEEWMLLHMRYVEQMNAEEIADALGILAESVRYKINKLMARLRARGRGFSE